MNAPVDTAKGKARQFIRNKSKYVVAAAIVVLVLYHSFYFETLEKRQAANTDKAFDIERYVKDFWGKLSNTMDEAADAKQLLGLLRVDVHKGIEEYSTKTGHVTSTHFFLLQGQGKILSVLEDGVLVSLTGTEAAGEILVATDLIFGNAVRDASGLVDSDDFEDSMDYNKVSEHINSIIMSEVIAPFRDTATEGATLRFIGAAEIFEGDPQISPLQIVPIRLELK